MVITQAGADQRVAELQRQRAGAGARAIDFPSGQHPFLSQPEPFADSIAAEVDSVA
jgi:hypothetical protein